MSRSEKSEHFAEEHSFVVIDFAGDSDKLGQQAYATAERVLPEESVYRLTGEWTRQNDVNRWIWQDPNEFVELVSRVFSAQFTGTLFIVLSTELGSRLKNWISDDLYDGAAYGQDAILAFAKSNTGQDSDKNARQHALLESVSKSINEEPVETDCLINILLHLWKQESENGRAILCCEAFDHDGSGKCFFPDGHTRFIEQLDHKNSDEVDAYVRTILTRTAYSVSPTVSERPKTQFLADALKQSKDWKEYSLQPKQVEYEDLLRQEIGSRTLARKFVDACHKAFAHDPDHPPFTLLPTEFQVALGAMRIARRLANLTLEGESFCCTVALFDRQAFDAVGTGTSAFSQIIDIVPDVPFTFPCIGKIRKHAEAAQGEGLFLLVNASTGMLTSIGCHNRANSPYRRRRHAFMSSLVSRRGMLMHIRDGGLVEVYTACSLAFWHDGFAWKYFPYLNVLKTFGEHFKLPIIDNESQEAKTNMMVAMLDSIRQLLDRRASSIIILLDPRDKESFEEVAYEQLRNELVWARNVAQINIDELDADALAGLLALDGAHVIDNQGKLVHICRRIDAPRPRYAIDINRNDKTYSDDRDLLVQNLRERIKHSQRFGEFAIRRFGNGDCSFHIFHFIDAIKMRCLRNWLDDERLTGKIENLVRHDQRIAAILSVESVSISPESPHSFSEEAIANARSALKKFVSGAENQGATCHVGTHTRIEKHRVATNDAVKFDHADACILFSLFHQGKPPNAALFQKFIGQEIPVEALSDGTVPKLTLCGCYVIRIDRSIEGANRKPASEVLSGATMEALFRIRQNNNIPDESIEYWYVLDDSIKRAAETRDGELPPEVQRKFRAIVRGDSDEHHAGTGTRAADEISAVLPNSKVMKISASGDIKIKPEPSFKSRIE